MVKCAWAAISEYGSINGKKGDQTGGEVRIGNWYYFGQNVVLRCKNKAKAKKMAENIKAIANNNHVGYGQSDRLTLYNAWRSVGWDHPEKIRTDCNTDCSQLISDVCISVGYDISPTNWTGSLKTALKGTGDFQVLTAAKWLTTSDYCEVGDIILNEASHVIMAIENGPKVKAQKAQKKSISAVAQEVIDGKWGVEPNRSARLKAAGYTAAEIVKIQEKVNVLLDKKQNQTPLKKGVVIATAGLNVRADASQYAKRLRALPYGTRVTCYGVKMNGKEPWWKIDKTKSEYVAARYIKAVK